MVNLLVNSDISKTVNLPIVMVFLNFVRKKENIFYQYTQKLESKNITIGFFIDCVFSSSSQIPLDIILESSIEPFLVLHHLSDLAEGVKYIIIPSKLNQ